MKKHYFISAVLLAISFVGLRAQTLDRYDNFESYSSGATNVDYWIEQTCSTDPCDECNVTPF
ncbi:MAG: hypothetical protein HC896_08915 [Bacteroidales bacterium]|nr:hypothetical protein [Bacteroidales bacterium]